MNISMVRWAVPLVLSIFGGCGGRARGGAAAASSCGERLEGGSWRAVEWKHAAGRGAPEVASEYYMANALTVYQAGRWETFLDGRAEGRGVARVWGGPYRVTGDRGDRCVLELSSVEEPQTPMGPLPIRFRGRDRFEVVDPAERVVFVRDRTRDASWLRAQAALQRQEPPVESAEGQPEDDIYDGTGADRWK
jgi:hypothetical protein